MSQQPASFLEFPAFDITVPTVFRAPDLDTVRRPGLMKVLRAQSVDHALCLIVGALLTAGSLSLVDKPFTQALNEAGAFFWIAQLTTVGAVASLYRLFFIRFDDATPGQRLAGVRACRRRLAPLPFWSRQLLEAGQVVFPMLWLLDLLGRQVGVEVAVHYKIEL